MSAKNTLISNKDFVRMIWERMQKFSPATQAAIVYSIQSGNGFPRDKKQEKQISDAFADEKARGVTPIVGEQP